jgi:hypothetical protein
MARAWEYWTLRLGARGVFPARAKTAAKAPVRKATAAPRKRARAVSKRRR